ncbi:MAG: nitroreductase family protein [Actinobacteria bacterium]|nr:nitroreductase family protein [Actinomycetota bacterium]
MDIYETITSRRTIRKFKQEEINPQILKKLVNSGRLAPSAANLQPLEYFVVDDRALKERIFPDLSWAGYIKPAGDPGEGERPAAYIIILADLKINPSPERDIGASAENINLAAEEEGIGCCWIGAFKKMEINKIISIPENLSAELIIALGYPLEKPVSEDIGKGSSIKYYKDGSGVLHVPKRRLEDILHFNKF